MVKSQSKNLTPTEQRPIVPFESVLESISDGVFTVDNEWRITSFNRAAEEILGVPRDEAIGRFCAEVFRSSMCQDSCALRQTLASGEPIINRVGYVINAEGNKVPISVSTAVLKSTAGQIIGGAETFRDLSEVEDLKKKLEGRVQIGDFISRSPLMKKVFDLVYAVSTSNCSVLIQGDTGTGKELLARAIHGIGQRAGRPFIALNCGALPDTLLEAELFGYKKGAFTGAVQDKPGRFALSRGGTFFMDEIGDISPAMQIKLLRVLQERSYEPLGGIRSEFSDARIIVATNRNLQDMVKQGKFRKDLFYRINVVRIEIPNLSQRKEDIPLLIEHFVHRFCKEQHRKIIGCSQETQSILMMHNWPGNVRELENVIERAFVVCRGEYIEPHHLPEELYLSNGSRIDFSTPENFDAYAVLRLTEKQMIVNVLKRNHYSRIKAACELGIHQSTLFRKMRSLGIELIRKKKSQP